MLLTRLNESLSTPNDYFAVTVKRNPDYTEEYPTHSNAFKIFNNGPYIIEVRNTDPRIHELMDEFKSPKVRKGLEGVCTPVRLLMTYRPSNDSLVVKYDVVSKYYSSSSPSGIHPFEAYIDDDGGTRVSKNNKLSPADIDIILKLHDKVLHSITNGSPGRELDKRYRQDIMKFDNPAGLRQRDMKSIEGMHYIVTGSLSKGVNEVVKDFQHDMYGVYKAPKVTATSTDSDDRFFTAFDRLNSLKRSH